MRLRRQRWACLSSWWPVAARNTGSSNTASSNTGNSNGASNSATSDSTGGDTQPPATDTLSSPVGGCENQKLQCTSAATTPPVSGASQPPALNQGGCTPAQDSSIECSVTVRPAGNGPLPISNAATDNSAWTVTEPCTEQPINAGDECTIRISVSAGGPTTGVLTVTAVGGESATITLSAPAPAPSSS